MASKLLFFAAIIFYSIFLCHVYLQGLFLRKFYSAQEDGDLVRMLILMVTILLGMALATGSFSIALFTSHVSGILSALDNILTPALS